MPLDLAAFLKSLPYFEGLSVPALVGLAGRSRQRSYARRELIVLEGEPAQAAYFVVSGQVRVYKLSPQGRAQVLDRLGSSQALNLVPLFDGLPNPASAEAVNAVCLCIIPRQTFLDAVANHPPLAAAVLADFSGRLRRLTLLVADLSFRTVRARVARFLLQQAHERGRRLTQAEMAAELGTVRDVVGRTLADLQAEGLIRTERHRIIIVDRAALERHASLRMRLWSQTYPPNRATIGSNDQPPA